MKIFTLRYYVVKAQVKTIKLAPYLKFFVFRALLQLTTKLLRRKIFDALKTLFINLAIFSLFLGTVMDKIDFLLNFKMKSVNIVLEEKGIEMCKVVIEGMNFAKPNFAKNKPYKVLNLLILHLFYF